MSNHLTGDEHRNKILKLRQNILQERNISLMEGENKSTNSSPGNTESRKEKFEKEKKYQGAQTCMQNETNCSEIENPQSEMEGTGGKSLMKESEHSKDEVNFEEVFSGKLIDQVKGVIYGNSIGDAIGLLTEFMSKEQARMVSSW